MAPTIAALVDRWPWAARITVALALIVLNGWGLWRFAQRRDPKYAIAVAAEAIRHRDSTAFAQAADADSIAASYYDQHLSPIPIKGGTAATPGQRERDVKSIARRLRRSIEIETDHNDTEETPRVKLIGTSIGEAVKVGAWSVDSTHEAHDICLATITLMRPAAPNLKLDMKVSRQQGRWRIVEVTNVEEVIKALRDAEQTRFEKLLPKIQAAVSVTLRPKAGPVSEQAEGLRQSYDVVFLANEAQAAVTFAVVCQTPDLVTRDEMNVQLRTPGYYSFRHSCLCPFGSKCPLAEVSLKAVVTPSLLGRLREID
jgi:hypothetical protein